MTPKQRAILSSVPVGQRAAAKHYYAMREVYEQEYSEFKRAQAKLHNAQLHMNKAANVLRGAFPCRFEKGVLYRGIRTGRYYEGQGGEWRADPLKEDGHNAKRSNMWVSEPVFKLAPDDPYREKRKVATICNRLEGKP